MMSVPLLSGVYADEIKQETKHILSCLALRKSAITIHYG